MKLVPPFALSTISQGFGSNAVNYQAVSGTVGHPGIDFAVPWGTPIPYAVDGYCYSVMSKNNPNLGAYRAVFTLIDDGDTTYEVSYGHCSDIGAVPGTTVKQGASGANVGNTGDVFADGVAVSEKAKEDGSRAGAHLHFQVRVCKKVPYAISLAKGNSVHRLNDGFGLYVRNGFVYEVPNYANGYNGCVNPAQFWSSTEESPYDKLVAVANSMMATNPTQARIILAVAGIVRAFGT